MLYRPFCHLVSPLLVLAFAVWGLAGEVKSKSSGIPSSVRSHCFACHSNDNAEAELNLESFSIWNADPTYVSRTLEKIRRVVVSGDMPPEYADTRPSRQEVDQLVAWIDQRSLDLASHYNGDPGVIIIPRLTRYEYRNVIRDLSGGIVTNAGRFLPNEGGAGEGFSNVGEAQAMSAVQIERFMEAAKDTLRYLRIDPHAGLIWHSIPHEPVEAPASARQELADSIIAWHVNQQQKWGELHRNALNERFGFVHAAYLEAAWKFRHRRSNSKLSESANIDGVRLSPVALEKWWKILNSKSTDSPFSAWAHAWRNLPDPDVARGDQIRKLCVAITNGQDSEATIQDFAPPYEISFVESRSEVLESAEERQIWPFRIDIGTARELFLVVTDAGDGGRGEYAIWQKGLIRFSDGTSRPWQEAVKVMGANSRREFKWGGDGTGAATLSEDSIGVQPPGALKFALPQDASVFEVELAIDKARTKQASIQALVLKEKPKTQSFIPGRYVFGGKRRNAGAAEQTREQTRALRLRNVAEANRTKIGLNAERNVFADWKQSDLRWIGGPWEDQDLDKSEPGAPYHYTVEEVLKNADPEDLVELENLKQRLLAVLQEPEQRILELAKTQGWEEAREGVLPNAALVVQWPSKAQARYAELCAKVEQQESQNESLVANWLLAFSQQAWRRSVSESELEALLGLYRRSRQQGLSFDGSVKSSLLAILVSPNFLFHGVQTDSSTGEPVKSSTEVATVPLSDIELASRLSFFLWGSIPDRPLLELALQGELHDPSILRQQARRMLKDPKAASLAIDFGGQLWGFADFESFQGPDEIRFREFTPELREAMQQEVVMFLDDLFRNDGSLSNLIQSDYTFANDRLARHYGFESVPGDNFERVLVDDRRGGLTGMSLFLTKSSLPLRTSPVQRGVWVLEQLLGEELPNPPANVQPLSDDETNQQGESIPEQLARHRESATCASCHNRIDPLGISLENYDPIGRWRDDHTEQSDVLSQSVTPDGFQLAGPASLRIYLQKHHADFFRHFHRKLLGYALGRSVGPGDTQLLTEIERKAGSNGRKLSDIIELIITSPQFTSRRATQTHIP